MVSSCLKILSIHLCPVISSLHTHQSLLYLPISFHPLSWKYQNQIWFLFFFLSLWPESKSYCLILQELQNYRVWELEGDCEISSHFSSTDCHQVSQTESGQGPVLLGSGLLFSLDLSPHTGPKPLIMPLLLRSCRTKPLHVTIAQPPWYLLL